MTLVVAPALLAATPVLSTELLAARLAYLRCFEAAVHLSRGMRLVEVDGLVRDAASAWMQVPFLPERAL